MSLEGDISDLKQRIRKVEMELETSRDEREALARLPELVAELKGAVDVLHDLVLKPGIEVSPRDSASTFKTAVQFASVVIVPIIIALIGGYFALRGAR